MISDLSDKATSNLLDFAAWAEGEKIEPSSFASENEQNRTQIEDEAEPDSQILQAVTAGNLNLVEEWSGRTKSLPDASRRLWASGRRRA